MKIYGTNHSNFPPYKDMPRQNHTPKQATAQEDSLEISEAAQEMHDKQDMKTKRSMHVEKIKQSIDKGEYEIDFKQTAKKMIDFWTGK